MSTNERNDGRYRTSVCFDAQIFEDILQVMAIKKMSRSALVQLAWMTYRGLEDDPAWQKRAAKAFADRQARLGRAH